jgi:tartrate dehydratase beta subunit/fumarate hydratase class I family protein
MEAIWRIEVEDFPAFIVIDADGNDFFTGLMDSKDRSPGWRWSRIDRAQ